MLTFTHEELFGHPEWKVYAHCARESLASQIAKSPECRRKKAQLARVTGRTKDAFAVVVKR